MTSTVGHVDRVVVGVDGTASSIAALAWAMRLAAAQDWVVEAVTAWPDPPHDRLGGHRAREHAVSVLGSAIVSAELRLATTRPTVVGCVDHGDPVDALVARSSNARLLVLGEHDDAVRRRLVSVAHSCSLLALCPVVVVHGTDVARAAAVDRAPSMSSPGDARRTP